jgi:hypothetical protein
LSLERLPPALVARASPPQTRKARRVSDQRIGTPARVPRIVARPAPRLSTPVVVRESHRPGRWLTESRGTRTREDGPRWRSDRVRRRRVRGASPISRAPRFAPLSKRARDPPEILRGCDDRRRRARVAAAVTSRTRDGGVVSFRPRSIPRAPSLGVDRVYRRVRFDADRVYDSHSNKFRLLSLRFDSGT